MWNHQYYSKPSIIFHFLLILTLFLPSPPTPLHSSPLTEILFYSISYSSSSSYTSSSPSSYSSSSLFSLPLYIFLLILLLPSNSSSLPHLHPPTDDPFAQPTHVCASVLLPPPPAPPPPLPDLFIPPLLLIHVCSHLASVC